MARTNDSVDLIAGSIGEVLRDLEYITENIDKARHILENALPDTVSYATVENAKRFVGNAYNDDSLRYLDELLESIENAEEEDDDEDEEEDEPQDCKRCGRTMGGGYGPDEHDDTGYCEECVGDNDYDYE